MTEENTWGIGAGMEMPVPTLSLDAVLKMYPDVEGFVELGDVVGIRRERLSRWRNNGLTLPDAEYLASKIGLHPSFIWGPEYHIAVYMLEIVEQIRYKHRLERQKMKRIRRKNEKAKTEQTSG
mgnify:FL=1